MAWHSSEIWHVEHSRWPTTNPSSGIGLQLMNPRFSQVKYQNVWKNSQWKVIFPAFDQLSKEREIVGLDTTWLVAGSIWSMVYLACTELCCHKRRHSRLYGPTNFQQTCSTCILPILVVSKDLFPPLFYTPWRRERKWESGNDFHLYIQSATMASCSEHLSFPLCSVAQILLSTICQA